jgi:hypothetical protein
MDDQLPTLTETEAMEGWHWCQEFDGLLLKGDPNEEFCGRACRDCNLTRELT